MSPLNSILVSDRPRRASVLLRTAACASLLLALVHAGRVAVAATPSGAHSIHEADARRAEKVLAKLRLLHNAADAGDAGAFAALVSKFYPALFGEVSELSPSDLSTDLSTAVFLAEKLGRTWNAASAAQADCTVERPDIYVPLCVGLRGGNVRQLLLAKSRLHARWAEAVLKNDKGEADAETARALDEMRAARENDQLLAARVAVTLKSLETSFPLAPATAGRGERLKASASRSERSEGSDVEFAEALRIAGEMLAWMPRSKTFYHLSEARLAYADGMSWYGKVRQSKRLVVSAANAFQPDPLKELKLDSEQVGATVRANWVSAIKYTRLAEQSLARSER